MADLDGWPTTQVLTTERLVLEALRVDHAGEVAAALDDPGLHLCTGGHPASASQLASRYARQVVGASDDGAQRWCNWVLRELSGGRALGYVQASVEAREGVLVAELAWVLARPAQGRGLAAEAAIAMATWLRGRGVARLIAHVHPDHHASAAVARRVELAPTTTLVDGGVRWSS